MAAIKTKDRKENKGGLSDFDGGVIVGLGRLVESFRNC